MLAQLLPPGVFGVEMHDSSQPLSLHPQEAALVAGAVEKRRREFALGRACAHAALAAMGTDAAVIGRGPDAAPLWPAGVVGSITHTVGYACAVVGARAQFVGMGVDAERVGSVGDKLLPRLFDEAERARLMAMGADERSIAATLGFSAKEACFKAWGAGFGDIHIEWGVDVFAAQSATGTHEGRFLVAEDLVLTAVFIPA